MNCQLTTRQIDPRRPVSIVKLSPHDRPERAKEREPMTPEQKYFLSLTRCAQALDSLGPLDRASKTGPILAAHHALIEAARDNAATQSDTERSARFLCLAAGLAQA